MISIVIIMVTTLLMFLNAFSLPSINAPGREIDQSYSESALSVCRDVNQSIPSHLKTHYCIENNSRRRLMVEVMPPFTRRLSITSSKTMYVTTIFIL